MFGDPDSYEEHERYLEQKSSDNRKLEEIVDLKRAIRSLVVWTEKGWVTRGPSGTNVNHILKGLL